MRRAILLGALAVSLGGLAVMARLGEERRIIEEAALPPLQEPGWRAPRPILSHPINGGECPDGWVMKKADNKEWMRACVDSRVNPRRM